MELKREELMKLEKAEIIDILFSVIAELAATIKIQSEEIKELKERLNKNSQNSSKPPSSDGLNKPKPKSQRVPSGRKPGGQRGHKGHGIKLPEKIDEIQSIEAHSCKNCDSNLDDIEGKVIGSRYVLDIPPIEVWTVKMEQKETICPRCGTRNEGIYPQGVNSTIQYGENIKAFVTTLVDYGMVSIDRTQEIIADAFGISMSTGTIQSIIYECANRVAPTVDAIRDSLIESPVNHYDETGFRVDGRLHWMHVASNEKYTYITVHPKRGNEGIDNNGVLPLNTGHAVHDCWGPYFQYTNCVHALCNAHLLRELTSVHEVAKQEWASDMMQLLLDLKNETDKSKNKGETCLPIEDILVFEEAYDSILQSGLALNPLPERKKGQKGKLKRGKTRCLLDRLLEHRNKVLLFAHNFQVPFDNNQAERDIRIFKVKQKVSGGLRSPDGAVAFAKVTSFIQTAKKQGASVFNALCSAFSGSSRNVVYSD